MKTKFRLLPRRSIAYCLFRYIAVSGVFLVTTTLAPQARAQAATGVIAGRVQDADAGTYLNNARIRISGTNRETFTNPAGEYRLSGVPAGNVTLEVFYTGFASQQMSVDVPAGDVARQDFNLSNAPTAAEGEGGQKVVQLSAFVVAGKRETNAAAIAINEQRFSANLKNVISTDAFGEINQGNIGEFVKHIPGVNIEFKDGNNPSGILVRGFGSNYTNVTIDGNAIASAAIANTQTPSRQFVLEQANINNLSRIEVTKEPLPDTPSNSLGGSVNLVSKSAMEYSRPEFRFSSYLSGNSYALSSGRSAGPGRDRQYKILPSFDGTLVLPLSKTFGVVINGSEMNQFYQTLKNAPARVFDPEDGASVTNPFTRSFTASLAPNTVHRTSGSVKLDWRPTDEHLLSVTAMASAFKQDSASRSINYNVGPATPVDWGETFTHGAPGATSSLGGTWQTRNALTRAISGNYTFTHGPWTAELSASYSNSNNRVRDTDKGFFTQLSTGLHATNATANFDDIDNGSMSFNGVSYVDASGNPIDTTKLDAYDLKTATSQPFNTQDSVTEYRGSVKRDFNTPWFPLSVKAGGATNLLVRDLNYSARQWTYVGPDGKIASGDETMAGLGDPLLAGSTPGYGLEGREWASPWAAYDLFTSHPEYFTRTPKQLGDQIKNEATRSPLLIERVSAAFVMADAQFFQNRLRLVGGVRYERTRDRGYGYKQDNSAIYQKDANGDPIIGADGKPLLLPELAGTVKEGPEQNALIYTRRGTYNARSYDGFFPSIDATYKITDTFLLRAAFAKTIGRPSPSDIVPNISVTPNLDPNSSGDSPGTISTSNTSLKPWTAKNYDLSLEYYMPHNGLASVGVFLKDVKDFFATHHEIADEALLDSLGLSHDYIGYDYSTRINAGDARIIGYELNYSQQLDFIPKVGRYFSVLANMTKLHVSGSNSGPETFNSFIPRTANAGLRFSKGRLTIGLYWNYRGKQVRDTSDAFPGAVEYILPLQTFDGNIEYQLTKHFSVFLAGRNISNAVTQWSLEGPDAPGWATVENDFTNGRQFSLGVKGAF
ncbi:MAG TPA: TonB-dependent receptor [Opitutaceae bacterium]|nr:TonB-dependent receptor [Opitutaceae bacterium]